MTDNHEDSITSVQANGEQMLTGSLDTKMVLFKIEFKSINDPDSLIDDLSDVNPDDH